MLRDLFWWKAHISLLDEFKKICKCSIGNGQTVLAWKDSWIEHKFQHTLPHLHSFALNDEQSVQTFFGETDWTKHFHLPLSVEAHGEFIQLQILQPTLLPTTPDKWTVIGSSGKISAIQIYNLLLDPHDEHPFFSIIWKSSSRLKYKIFFWLVAHCRINTRALLLRKGMHLDDIHYPNSNQQAEETTMHLLWDCNFAQDCWNSLLPLRKRGTSVYEDTVLASTLLPKHFAIEIII